jgi:hypothetical protein
MNEEELWICVQLLTNEANELATQMREFQNQEERVETALQIAKLDELREKLQDRLKDYKE